MNDLRAIPAEIQWHERLPIYASPEFLSAESNEFGWIGGIEDSGSLRCLVPYTVIRKFGIRMIRFRTATIPLADDLSLEEEKAFLESVVGYFRRSGADLVLPSGNSAVFRTCPAGSVSAPYGTVINDLTQSEEKLWSGIRKTYRQNIRKAEAAGVEIKTGLAHLDAAYFLIADTMKRSGASFTSYNNFKRKILALGENVLLFAAVNKGTMEGCMAAPFSRHTAYNLYAGSAAAPTLGAMHLLHWKAMLHFRSLGVRFFDFQGVRIKPEPGSKQEGIAHYKRGFGGCLIEGCLWKYPLQPLKSAGYSVAARLLNGGDIVDQERRRLAEKVEYAFAR